MVILVPAGWREVSFRAPSRAARTTTAVPCWSSCMIGMVRIFLSLSSMSKHLGALMSSKLMAAKESAMRFTVSTNSLTS